MVLGSFAAAHCVEETVHYGHSDAVSWYGHGAARSPLVFDGVVFVDPIGIVAVAWGVVSATDGIESTLKVKISLSRG